MQNLCILKCSVSLDLIDIIMVTTLVLPLPLSLSPSNTKRDDDTKYIRLSSTGLCAVQCTSNKTIVCQHQLCDGRIFIIASFDAHYNSVEMRNKYYKKADIHIHNLTSLELHEFF